MVMLMERPTQERDQSTAVVPTWQIAKLDDSGRDMRSQLETWGFEIVGEGDFGLFYVVVPLKGWHYLPGESYWSRFYEGRNLRIRQYNNIDDPGSRVYAVVYRSN